jgi:hypothetical protein
MFHSTPPPPYLEARRSSLAEEVRELAARVEQLEGQLKEAPTSEALAAARAIQVVLSAKLQGIRTRLTACEDRAAAAQAKAAALEAGLASEASLGKYSKLKPSEPTFNFHLPTCNFSQHQLPAFNFKLWLLGIHPIDLNYE